MIANYNRTAWFYDHLAKLVFGNSIIKAQSWLLKHIPAKSHVLIVGGGTGWILEKIAAQRQDLTITYVEVAVNMMSISKKRNYGNNLIRFLTDDIMNIYLPQPADVILTPFFFSNFTEGEAKSLFTHLNRQLKPGGTWLNADFQIAGKWWHKTFLSVMYWFFSLFGAVRNNQLFNVAQEFDNNIYKTFGTKTFYGTFIFSTVWIK